MVLDGWLYVAGGSQGTCSLKSMERYDPLTEQWAPVQQMRFPRSNFGIGVFGGSKICAIGGHCGTNEIEHCELYDPSIDKWSNIADLNKPRMHHGVVTVHSEKMFVVGGKNFTGPLDCIEKYNASLNMWLIVKHTLEPRFGSAVAHVNFDGESNWLYVVGGLDTSKCYHSSVKRINLMSIDYCMEADKAMDEPRAYAGYAVL